MFDLIKIRSIHPLTRYNDFSLKKIDNVTLIFIIPLQVFFIFISLVFKWSRNDVFQFCSRYNVKMHGVTLIIQTSNIAPKFFFPKKTTYNINRNTMSAEILKRTKP